MIRDLDELHRLEDESLAPYAMRNSRSRKRRFHVAEHPFRTDFQRDRDRILHSKAFRRLEYKTQVFLNGTGDHLRTRLTHTIEVAAIARTMARSLRLNEDLAESISLAHDLGHTPFGHAGERAMRGLMSNHGGFDHNDQALRVVDILEKKYPDYDGINLTWETRTGLVKHRLGHQSILDGEELPPNTSLEGQIADLADDLTYYGHDVDDGLDSGLITESMLDELEIWSLASATAEKDKLADDPERHSSFTVRCLIDMMVGDAIRNSEKQIAGSGIQTPAQAQNSASKTISFSPEFARMTSQLRGFLYHHLYFHPEVEKANSAAVTRMGELFDTYVRKPELMNNMSHVIEHEGLHRAVADYIAGMTDRFAFLEHNRCCGKSGSAQ